MTPEGRQDLAAVIAELHSELDGTRPPIQHRERIHAVPRSLLKRVLALLLAGAAPVSCTCPAPEYPYQDHEPNCPILRFFPRG